MLPKHKQGAPAPEKVLTFFTVPPSNDGGDDDRSSRTAVLWCYCGLGVVRYSQSVWCATHKGIRTGADFGTMAGSLTSTVAHPCLHAGTLFTPLHLTHLLILKVCTP